MTRVLVHAYDVKRDHLDAYDVEALIVPAIVDEKTWVPELDREDLLYHRLFLAEKWLVLKLRYGHADPRDAGVGNIVNCGAAMYIAPVGIANAGDPRRAYDEALDLTGGAPVELRPRGRGRARRRRRRGDAGRRDRRRRWSRRASRSPRTARGRRSRRSRTPPRSSTAGATAASPSCGAAFAPFDSVGEHYATPALNARIPSRLHAIEELPIALGLLVATGGDYEETVLGGVNYGRDSDSIASMGGALAGRARRIRSAATGSTTSPPRAGSTSRRRAGRWPSSRRRSSPATSQRHQERAQALAALTAGEVPA